MDRHLRLRYYTLLTNKRPPLPTDIDDDMSEDKHLALPFPEVVSKEMKHLVLWMMSTNRILRPQSVNTVFERSNTPNFNFDDEVTIVGETFKPQPITNKEKIQEDTNTYNNVMLGFTILIYVICMVGVMSFFYSLSH